MNITTALPLSVSEALLPMATGGAPATGVFAWVNALISQAYGVVLGAVVFIALLIVILASWAGKWKFPGIIGGIVLAALFSWGAFSGVNLLKTQIDQTTTSVSSGQSPVHSWQSQNVDLQE